MFIRVSHKIERVVAKHWKINLCLVGMAFFTLLTAFVYFMPDAAKNVMVGLDCFWGLTLFMLIFVTARKSDYETKSFFEVILLFLSTIGCILDFMVIAELVIFGKLALFAC